MKNSVKSNIIIKLISNQDANFKKICDYCELNINRENHSENGGTLNYKNLTYHSDILLVAFSDDIPVAYNTLVFANSETIYCNQYAVKKEFQGQGIGTLIMSKAVEIAKKINMDLSGHVKDYNIASRKVFESLGFKKIDAYSTPDNFYFLLKQKKLTFKDVIGNLKRK